MTVKAKFRVASITRTHDKGSTVKLEAIEDASIPEDQRFAKGVPVGMVVIFLDSPSAELFFDVGALYYLEFTPTPNGKEMSA